MQQGFGIKVIYSADPYFPVQCVCCIFGSKIRTKSAGRLTINSAYNTPTHMDLSALTAISPADGRYRHQLQQLAEYFSEFALIRYRVRIEVEYFIALSAKKLFPLKAN